MARDEKFTKEETETVEALTDNSQREVMSVMISDGIYKSVYKDTGEDVV